MSKRRSKKTKLALTRRLKCHIVATKKEVTSTENPDLRSDYPREVQDMLRAICKRLKLLFSSAFALSNPWFKSLFSLENALIPCT
jgi:hypothetical protein